MYRNLKPLRSILTSKWTPLLPAQSVKIGSLGRAPAVNIHKAAVHQATMKWVLGRIPLQNKPWLPTSLSEQKSSEHF